MSSWSFTLKLSDIFHDEDLPFPELRDEIARRIRAAEFFDEEDLDLVELVEGLAATEDAEEFDLVWRDFYDWTDLNRVWVETV